MNDTPNIEGGQPERDRQDRAQRTRLESSARDAARTLRLERDALGDLLGVDGATVDAFLAGESLDTVRTNDAQLLVVVRVFWLLVRMVGEAGLDTDSMDAPARQWLRRDNPAFGRRPMDHLRTADGASDVVAYLQAASF